MYVYTLSKPVPLQAETVVKAIQSVQHTQQQVQNQLCLQSVTLLTFSLLPHLVLHPWFFIVAVAILPVTLPGTYLHSVSGCVIRRCV